MSEHLATLTATALTTAEANAALAFLGVTPGTADRRLLDALLTAYTRTVSWESASRIAYKTQVGDATRPRAPGLFWEQARTSGTGGTCFESNGAFAALLRALGYDLYFTVNDMRARVGVHTAIVVRLAKERYIADVGMPFYASLPLNATHATVTDSPFHTYTVAPTGDDCYEITRDRHPSPYCFTLLDHPVTDAAYWETTAADYGPTGLFLDRVILMKTVGTHILRFDSGARDGAVVEAFANGQRDVRPLSPDYVHVLSDTFGVNAEIIRAALDAIGYDPHRNREYTNAPSSQSPLQSQSPPQPQ